MRSPTASRIWRVYYCWNNLVRSVCAEGKASQSVLTCERLAANSNPCCSAGGATKMDFLMTISYLITTIHDDDGDYFAILCSVFYCVRSW